MLLRISRSTVKSEQKLDWLLASGIRVMETALKPINPVKGGAGGAILRSKQHRDGNHRQTGKHGIRQNEPVDQGIFTANVIRKPYARQFAGTVPEI